MSDLIGKSLGRYRILEQIGEGGMATVYKAHDTRLDAEVAVKVIRTENLAPSILERALKRFEREAKALARLTHPNIVKVIDYGEYEDKPYLVLEYLPGGSLKKRLGKPIPWQEAFQLILPIARALDYAHRQNMIHRDVKPSNILMTEDGEPMLTDFGIAKVLDLEETADLTGTGMGIGTPEYMAPEQWQGNTSTQSDLYSLGVLLYEMITGRKPYTANTPAALLLKQANDPLPRPSEFVRDLLDKVENILLRALAKEPKERFKDMGEFIKAMDNGLKSEKVPTERSIREPSQTPFRRTSEKPVVGNRIPEGTRPTQTAVPEKSFGRANAGQSVGKRNRNFMLPVSIILGVGALLFGVYLFNDYKTSTSSSNPQLLTISSEETPTTETLVATTVIFTETSLPSTPTPTPGIGSTMISEKDGMILVYVPAGEFTIGSEDGDTNENPVNQIYLDSYWIDQTEVTNEMYAKCVTAMACKLPMLESHYYDQLYVSHPVIGIAISHAEEYCAWAGRRLPTDAEWEKAASWNDQKQEKLIYPWGNEADCSLANYYDGSRYCVGDTSPVGSYPDAASPYGALDMAGNVWELVSSGYFRGGAWDSKINDMKSANRDTPDITGLKEENRGWFTWVDTSNASSNISPASRGFRCARSVP